MPMSTSSKEQGRSNNMSVNKRKLDENNDSEVHDVEVSQTDDSITENEDDAVVTMVDVLEAQNDLEADANAILGGADLNNCTYSQGYVPRQALYACKTCSGEENAAAVCVACSYKCHEGHDLVELYTKRNFRCDCGNQSFQGAICSLFPVKDDINLLNVYNHNFKGLYCVCDKPYPDPDDDTGDMMIQCVVCEDWYHARHLKASKTSSDTDGDLVCHLCVEKVNFLCHYQTAASAGVADGCKLASARQPVPPVSVDETAEKNSEAIFLPEGWRENLCKCSDCINLYDQLEVSFLMNESDSVVVYEEKNKALAGQTQYERGMEALESMDYVQRVEAIQSFNDLRTELMEHLRQFKDNNKVVTETDIRQFFNNMKAKRPRLEIPSTCR